MKKIISFALALIMAFSTLVFSSAETSDNGHFRGDTVTFGSYPQSEVTDEKLTAELNGLVSEDDFISFGYMSGNGELSSEQQGDYMSYADVTYNGEKYRGVTFTDYKPYYIFDEANKNSYITVYYYENFKPGEVYWFKFEPLKWKIGDAGLGNLLCNSIIDAQQFAKRVYKNGNYYYCDSEFSFYANNYAESYMREWLNSDFYNTAFSEEEKAIIKTTEVSNNASFVGAGPLDPQKYASETTYDKVYLANVMDAAYQFDFYPWEYYDSYSSNSKRIAYPTDYALIQGATSEWLLRTASNYSDFTNYTTTSGGVSNSARSYCNCSGVRPMVRVDVSKLICETYNIKWYSDGKLLRENNYLEGSKIFPPTGFSHPKGWIFKGWDKDFSAGMPAENIVINAVYERQFPFEASITETELKYKKTAQITVESEISAVRSLGYKSSNEDIATVDDNGKVTAVGKGVVNITVFVVEVDGIPLTREDGTFVEQTFQVVCTMNIFNMISAWFNNFINLIIDIFD